MCCTTRGIQPIFCSNCKWSVTFFFFFFNLFIYLLEALGFSLRCTGFSLQWLLLLRSVGSRCAGFSSCGTQAQQLWLTGSRVQAQQLGRMGLVALRYVGSSQTRARTRVPCIGRRILNHCATREVPSPFFLIEVQLVYNIVLDSGYSKLIQLYTYIY